LPPLNVVILAVQVPTTAARPPRPPPVGCSSEEGEAVLPRPRREKEESFLFSSCFFSTPLAASREDEEDADVDVVVVAVVEGDDRDEAVAAPGAADAE